MKLIIIDHSLETTGAFKAVLANVKQPNKSPEVLFFIPQTSKNASILQEKGIKFYKFVPGDLRRSALSVIVYVPLLLFNAFNLARIVRKEKISLVYQNEIFIITGIIAKLFVSVSVVTHIRLMPTMFPKLLFKTWLFLHDKFSDRMLATSFVCRDAAMNVYPCRQQIGVAYSFVPQRAKLPDYEVRNCNDGARILFIGNYTRGKGHDKALEAVKKLIEDHPGYRVELRMYGSDFDFKPNILYKTCLREYVEENNLGEFVYINGFADDVEPIMKDNDVLLNLSAAESFSWVVAEGMYYGIPVIATDSGGPGELIEDQVSGLLVTPDAASIANAMWSLLQSKEKRVEMSIKARARINDLVSIHGGDQLFPDAAEDHVDYA